MSDKSHTVGELHRGYLKRSDERILQLKEWIAAQNDEYERMQRELSTLAQLNDDAAIKKRSNLVKDMSVANAYVRTWEAEINLLETYGRNVRTELELLEAEYGGN